MSSISTAAEWVAHAAGSIGVAGWTGAVLGLGFGCVYGVDGWRGSVKEVDFKHSPRVKNLIYAVTLLVGTVVGDNVCAADKPQATLSYLIAFLLAAASTVIGMGVAICFNVRSRAATQKVPPVTDYLYWGYAYYSNKLDELATQALNKASQNDRNLLLENAKYLSKSFATVAVTLRNSGHVPVAQLKSLAQTTLQAVCAIIKCGSPEDRFNANYMIAYEWGALSTGLRDSVRYCGKSPGGCGTFLVLAADAYAEYEEREAFALPVPPRGAEGAAVRVLPGAPEAFFHDKPVIIDDTGKIRFGTRVEKGVRKKISAYFATKSFKSFASLPIIGNDGETIGILNVESSGRSLLGKSKAEKSHMAALLGPYCVILGLILAEIKSWQTAAAAADVPASPPPVVGGLHEESEAAC